MEVKKKTDKEKQKEQGRKVVKEKINVLLGRRGGMIEREDQMKRKEMVGKGEKRRKRREICKKVRKGGKKRKSEDGKQS